MGGVCISPLIEYLLPKFEEVYEGSTLDNLHDFLVVYLEQVSKLAHRLTADGTLYLAVCGHESPRRWR